ncbi:MAG: UDP-N-acetylglucosamine 2-epimerase [Methylophilaceae bacterium]
MNKRKICVVTGSRAEYGLLYWVMKEIQDDSDLQLQVIVTGMHLSPEFGLTYQVIETDGFTIEAKVEMLLSSDTSIGVSKSIGLGIIGFADAYERLQPDIVVVLGDRFEILAATQAAFVAGLNVAHISGGEVTEGAIDDAIRHCITKMSRYHFVASEIYRNRVIQLGEAPDNVFNVGDPGLDNIERLSLLSSEKLSIEVGFNITRPFFLVTFHPTTLGLSNSLASLTALLDALDEFPGYAVLLTKSNADMGGREINKTIDGYANARLDRVKAITSLGQLKYLSAMNQSSAVIGNSSSGIVEAPAMHIPTVNIGTRQQGRLKASSVIDCNEEKEDIVSAIERAISDDFGLIADSTTSLYGNCKASNSIVKILKESQIDRQYSKKFYDISV